METYQVQISINGEVTNCSFIANYIEEPNGMFSWHIPEFDIYFSSKTKPIGDNKAKSMVKSFFNFQEYEKNREVTER